MGREKKKIKPDIVLKAIQITLLLIATIAVNVTIYLWLPDVKTTLVLLAINSIGLSVLLEFII